MSDVEPEPFDTSMLGPPIQRIDSTLVRGITDIALGPSGWAAVLMRGQRQVKVFDSPSLQHMLDSIPIESLGSRVSVDADSRITILTQDQQHAILIPSGNDSSSRRIVVLPTRTRDVCRVGDRLFVMQATDGTAVVGEVDLTGRLIRSFGKLEVSHPTLARMASVGRIACSNTHVVAASGVFGILTVFNVEDGSVLTHVVEDFIPVDFEYDEDSGVFTPTSSGDTTNRITRVGFEPSGEIWVAVVTQSAHLGRQVGSTLRVLDLDGKERRRTALPGELLAIGDTTLVAYENYMKSSIGVYHE